MPKSPERWNQSPETEGVKEEETTFKKGDRVRIKHPGVVSSDEKFAAFDVQREYEIDDVEQDADMHTQLLHVKGFPKNRGWLPALYWTRVRVSETEK